MITVRVLMKDPEDSLITGNKELCTIPKKESDEFINSSVEDLVPIPSESKDTSGSDCECILPSCDDFSPINVFEEKSVTFFNPHFDSNGDFTFSDDESLSDEDVPKDNVKIYSNLLFEFDDEYISSDVKPLLMRESSSYSLNDDVHQSLEEVTVPSSNTQSFSNNMVPNVDEASTSHNVFNERLEDAYFDANTSFHDPSNVHTFYQPYPHEKK
nr:hypothetical protein [Tanacetum cinerariifolium]